MLFAWTVIVLLILANALYVAGEFAAVGVRRSRLRRMADDGHALAARILPVVDDAHALDRYIAVSQVGITLSSLVLGAFAQATLGPSFAGLLTRWAGLEVEAAESTGAVVLLLGLTALQMVFGELVPKSVALRYPTQAALYTVLPMEWSMRVSRWAVALLNGSGMLILRLLRVPLTSHRHVHSPEEIELLIAESRDGGLLEPQEQVRLHRALRLGLRTARELMVPRARLGIIDLSTPSADIVRIVASSPYSRLPVYRDTPENVVGILHTKDVTTRVVRGGELSVGGLMRPIVRVRDTMPADRLLSFLKERRNHQALVVDAADNVVGLVTLEDVISELLGGVADEFKSARTRRPAEGEGPA